MTDLAGSVAVNARDELLLRSSHAVSAGELFAEASMRLRRLVPFDAAVLRATDPSTGLMTAPVRVENLGEGGCTAYWDCELRTEKVNRYRDLARAKVPVAGLRESTGDKPSHSALYGEYLRPRGFGDELRAVLRVGDRPYGQISLFRERGRAAFHAAEVEFVAGLSAPLALRLRSYAEPSVRPVPGSADGPGLLLFDSAGSLLSINDEAREYLADMPPGPYAATQLGVPLPAWVHSTAVHARRLTAGSSRIRVRAVSGQWLVCHASRLAGADGSPGMTAMVIEPAKASEVMSLVVEAYGLSDRELEVTALIARGLATADIARALVISPHTVRDHIKAVFDKAGVSSRGELIAKLFTEHYEPHGATNLVRT